jgi:hypothetical protein
LVHRPLLDGRTGPQWTVQGFPPDTGRTYFGLVGVRGTACRLLMLLPPYFGLVGVRGTACGLLMPLPLYLGGVTTSFPPTSIFPGFPPDVALFAHILRPLSHLMKQDFLKDRSLLPAQYSWQAPYSEPHCARLLAAEATSAPRTAGARIANKANDFRMMSPWSRKRARHPGSSPERRRRHTLRAWQSATSLFFELADGSETERPSAVGWAKALAQLPTQIGGSRTPCPPRATRLASTLLVGTAHVELLPRGKAVLAPLPALQLRND